MQDENKQFGEPGANETSDEVRAYYDSMRQVLDRKSARTRQTRDIGVIEVQS